MQANATATPARILPALVLAQFLGTSPWFAVNAVMLDLQREQGWQASAVGTLTASLQWGFIAGTLVFALLAVADRFPARRVFVACAACAALCTLAAAASASSFTALLGWRALTGFFLAGIYPVGMKIASLWFPQGLGAALGWLVAALVLGSASPHALRALGANWPWQWVFFGVAAAAAGAAAVLWFGVPEPAQRVTAAPLKLGVLSTLWTDRRLRASVLGYFGHMVELYSMWVLVPLILASRLIGDTAIAGWSFAVLAAGSLGCVWGGWWASRKARSGQQGSADAAAIQLAISGACCLAAPWLLQAPLPIFLSWLLLWGATVAGDSPQLSALTAANAPRQAVGSALTLSNSLGFAISAVSIETFVRLSGQLPLAELLPWLALGPLLGLLAMRPLLGSQK